MGVFGAFNYGLHLFGGYLGGRFLSNRNLFVGGMVAAGARLRAASPAARAALLYWGLALFLTGSGLNVTCINMMLTQRFTPDDLRRESAFLWNYAGMNIGFFVGFTVAGHFQPTENYSRPLHLRDDRQLRRDRARRCSSGRRSPTGTRRCSSADAAQFRGALRRRRRPSSSASCRSCGSCCSTPAAPRRWSRASAPPSRSRSSGSRSATRTRASEQHVGLPDPDASARSCSGRSTRWRRAACSSSRSTTSISTCGASRSRRSGSRTSTPSSSSSAGR